MSKIVSRWFLGFVLLLQLFAFQNCSQFEALNRDMGAGLSSAELSSLENSEDLLPDPGWQSPRLKVHAGKIENFMPKIELPHMELSPYEVSGWSLTQWRKQSYIMPTDMKVGDDRDSVLGTAKYTMKSSSGESEIKMFKHPQNGGFVFELTGRQGWLAHGGGSNVFVSADVRSDRKNTFDGKITLSLESKLVSASAVESVAGANRDGSVVGQYFSGFTVSYEDPTGRLPRTALFIQIHHADTRGRLNSEYRGCYPHNGYQEIVYSNTLAGDHYYAAASGSQDSLSRKQFDVNRYLCEALARDFSCVDDNGTRSNRNFKEYGQNLANWKVGSYYTGLETQAAFGSATVPSTARGTTEMKVQLADIRLTRDKSVIYASCEDYVAQRGQVVPVTPPAAPAVPAVPAAPSAPSVPLPASTPSVPSSTTCSSGNFNNGNQLVEYRCGCGVPTDEGWVAQGNQCYHRWVKDSFFCAAGKKTYFRCDKGNPGQDWVDVGGGCFHLGTQEGCS
ncbi:MAG: hypothetical protein HUU57_10830 [Bdellovibrio sp.]|nr:hypothetical protein [Bdellovibrio sp.]